jgi:DNA-directed RNA polymerase sigma subunit (sigma70/sigma32)
MNDHHRSSIYTGDLSISGRFPVCVLLPIRNQSATTSSPISNQSTTDTPAVFWYTIVHVAELTREETAELAEISPDQVRLALNSPDELLPLDRVMGEEEETEFGHFVEDEDSPAPPDATVQVLLAKEIDRVLATLDAREEMVLRLRYGLRDGCTHTLEEIGDHLGLTRGRIRQIEAQALRRLRHPRRGRCLRDYLG